MSLKIIVQVWCEIDPTLSVRIDRDSGEAVADDGDVLTRVSSRGRIGVSTACLLSGAEVCTFSVGAGHIDALRHSLAAGAHRAVQLIPTHDDSHPIAVRDLANWLTAQSADLLIADRLAGRVAGRAGWAHLSDISDLMVRDGTLHAIRHLGQGDREEVTAQLPAAVRLHAESIRPPYVSRARILAVSPQQIVREEISSSTAESGIDAGPLQPLRARTRMGGATLSSSTSGLDRLNALMTAAGAPAVSESEPGEEAESTPEEMADQFVRYLLHHNLFPS